MMELEITYEGLITVEPEYDGEEYDPEAEIEQAFSLTMSELVKLGLTDPSFSGSVATGEFEMSCVIEATSVDEAFSRVDTTFRAALHAARVWTNDWQKRHPRVRVTLITRCAKANIADELVDA